MRHFASQKFKIVSLIGSVLLAGAWLMIISLDALAQTPSPVLLNYFNVAWNPDLAAVSISWETAVEFDVSGFSIERALWPSGTFTQTGEFVPAVGNQIIGATYGPFFDTDVVTGTLYLYQLVVYDGNGHADRSVPRVAVGTAHVFLPLLRSGG
ncbi:MAG: hypothetical protein U0559_07780 [Anaerolineae bacterium]